LTPFTAVSEPFTTTVPVVLITAGCIDPAFTFLLIVTVAEGPFTIPTPPSALPPPVTLSEIVKTALFVMQAWVVAFVTFIPPMIWHVPKLDMALPFVIFPLIINVPPVMFNTKGLDDESPPVMGPLMIMEELQANVGNAPVP
jgi:hypothetical protein